MKEDNCKKIMAAPNKRTKDKLCIIGCSDSKTLAPIDDPGYEFWGVNNLFFSVPDVPWTRWFEIHNITFDGLNFSRRGDRNFRGVSVDTYLSKIAGLKCPVYMQKVWPSIKNSMLYPLKEIVTRYGRYLTNTISYQIALGIYLGFSEISIYGVDMAVGTEYAKQRPSCEYFVGLAKGLGINVILPDAADLMKNRFLYGFEEQKEDRFQKKIKHTIAAMQTRRQQAIMQRDLASKQVEQYTGSEVGLSEMLKIWDGCK